MQAVSVIVAGGSQTIRVVADAEGVTLSNGPYWQQRLTLDEALRPVEAIERLASRAWPPGDG
jgi:hypothetical protein